VQLSCCTWALSGPEENTLATLADIGFSSVDIQAKTFQSPDARDKIQDLGLTVSCLALSFNVDDGAALDSADPTARQTALDHCRAALDHAADLGVDTTYVVPGEDPAALPYFSQTLPQVADFAAEHSIRVGVEHFPSKALPTAAGTLEYLADLGHPNLYLLLDTGHLQMSKEDPATVIATAGDRLGYVHLDDNDGEGDLHWSLLDGVLTEEALGAIFTALGPSPYTGPVSLELNPNLPDPATALKASRDLVLPHL
jgi:D-psicose/D-tagatose/L-ribulose 3-epimerase